MAASSSSSLAGARAGTAGRNAACSRSHQPAPMPQNARPPLSASRVATVLARIPGARNVTGVTSVPRRRPGSRPASIPSVTHGSGIGSQARPTCGIWIRWSISAIPCKPASAAARATAASQAPGLPGPHPTGTARSAARGPSGPAAAAARSPRIFAPGVCDGLRLRRLGAPVTRSQPSASISAAAARIRRSWPSSTGAGTGRSRARLRRRHSGRIGDQEHRDGGQPAAPGQLQIATAPRRVEAQRVDHRRSGRAGAGPRRSGRAGRRRRRTRPGRARRCRPRARSRSDETTSSGR